MIHVLKHVESITQHRDRTLLELGVASALFELVKAREVNIYRVSSDHQAQYLERITHVGADGVRYSSEFDDVDAVVPLASRPEMVACVEHSQIVRRHNENVGTYVHCFPISVDRGVLGVLEVSCDKPLADDDLGTAEGFLGLYRNYLSLLDYSERDTLTGMLNRKTFDENLSKILAGMASQTENEAPGRRRRQQDDGSYWLAVVDVDHFKRVNDQFGHLYGDEVLLLLARIMRESFRHQDKLFRFGGEEFVVVIRAGSENEVETALERFRTATASYAFPQVGTVTASIGYTRIHPQDTIPDIVGRADEALYFAKENGRNQLASHEVLCAAGKITPREKPESDIELF
ncbi:GGDEF domain-containing protein [Zoogloea sp.]|uniref:GGDEF domain-containing protein n=1 Tax=Zoogloea sp. TaxID=49181 RepID=UPI0026245ED6|nr:GGDEF domain-containing protein [Zoogloea sp.]